MGGINKYAEVPVVDPQLPPKPTCPHCGGEVDLLYTTRSISLRWNAEDGWVKSEDDQYHTVHCPHCYEELDDEALEEMGVPSELQ